MQFGGSPWRRVRARLRGGLFTFLRKVAATDDGRDIVAGVCRGLPHGRPESLEGLVAGAAVPYPDLGEAAPTAEAGAGAIFITSRFRTGSTLLWNLFRNMPGFTAYYEPLNERRWFDPAQRGDRVDPTHRNVSDYWREYEGLEELGAWYQESWISRHLLMEADHWDPAMQAYVQRLIDRAAGRAVLQFNRIDFRLPWYRHHFPAARLVHLYRHPRDQWCSALLDPTRFPHTGTMAEFRAHDGFYLLMWAEDLKHHFPFLDERQASHPYELFYYLWKLSYLFGRKYAHHSMAFEDLVTNPRGELVRLFEAVEVEASDEDLSRLTRVIVKPSLGKWKEYAPNDWFQGIERKCETVLTRFLADTGKTRAAEPELYPLVADGYAI